MLLQQVSKIPPQMGPDPTYHISIIYVLRKIGMWTIPYRDSSIFSHSSTDSFTNYSRISPSITLRNPVEIYHRREEKFLFSWDYFRNFFKNFSMNSAINSSRIFSMNSFGKFSSDFSINSAGYSSRCSTRVFFPKMALGISPETPSGIPQEIGFFKHDLGS